MSTTLAEPAHQPGPGVDGSFSSFQRMLQPFWALLPFAIIYVAAAAQLALQDDEAYYWCWTQQWQLSYYDHAPMCAWMIAASTSVFGHSVFAVRIPTLICALVALWVIYALSKPRTLFPLVGLTPAIAILAIVITPDSPLVAFWSLYVYWLVKVHERLETEPPPLWMWILGGLLLGCCILGKYTAALAIPSGLATFWFVKSWRRCVWGYAIHIGVAFVTSLPILIYNIQEDFQPLLFQWRHATDNEPWSLRPVGEFVGVQILAAGAIPFLVFGWSLWQYRRLAQEPRLRVCLCLFVVPFAFFCYRGIRMRMEANWTLISYIAIWPLLAAWYDTVKFSFRWRVAAIAAFVPPVAITLFLSAHIVHPIPVASARVDRISRQTGREAVFTEVAAYWRALEHPAPVFVHRYQCASMLRFKGVEAYPLHGHRHNHFTKTGKRYQDQERFFVLAEGPLTPEEAGGMTFTEVAHTPLYVRGEKLSVITLYAYSRP